MENALKKPFRSYGKPEILGSVMISIDYRATSDSAKFLLKKINMIERGELLFLNSFISFYCIINHVANCEPQLKCIIWILPCVMLLGCHVASNTLCLKKRAIPII